MIKLKSLVQVFRKIQLRYLYQNMSLNLIEKNNRFEKKLEDTKIS